MESITASDQHDAMSYLIDAHLAHLRALGQSPYTIEARESVLRRLHDALPYGLVYVEVTDLDAWLGRYTGWSLYTYDSHIRAFCTWADGVHLDCSALLAKPRPKSPTCLPNPVTDDELRTALQRSDPWWHLVIHLASLAGLRVSEIAGLRREDVTETTVLIRRGKGGDPGNVPTHPYLWRLLRAMPPGRVVLSCRGEAILNGHYLSVRARRHFDGIDLPGVHLHRFRDWYATSMLNAGATIRTVQECLRHKSITSTQGYTLVTGNQRREAVASLPVLTELEPASIRLEPSAAYNAPVGRP